MKQLNQEQLKGIYGGSKLGEKIRQFWQSLVNSEPDESSPSFIMSYLVAWSNNPYSYALAY